MFAFLLAAAIVAESPANPCAYDRERLLSLDEKAFDQDLKGGWRPLADDPRCEIVAADLIRDYRKLHPGPMDWLLFWHEGQVRAGARQTRRAIELFEHSRKQTNSDGWNFYVDGTIAFLRHDRAALQAARDKLAAVPKPPDFHFVGPDGKPMNVDWPLNLNILDGFLTCFDRSYEQAYGTPRCAKPLAVIETPAR